MIRLIKWLYLKLICCIRLIINLLGYIFDLFQTNRKVGFRSMAKTSNKSIQKCVRMNVDTYNYINSFDGNGFNQKFENACHYFENSQKSIDVQIECAQKELDRIRKHVYDLSKLDRNLIDIKRYLNMASSIVDCDMPKLIID